jgi:hypothetical protein
MERNLMNKPITIDRFVIQCTTNYVDHDKQVYITENGFSIHLTDAKLYDSEKNARAAVRYWKKNNKFNKDYCIFRVRQTFEIRGIINGGLNDAD